MKSIFLTSLLSLIIISAGCAGGGNESTAMTASYSDANEGKPLKINRQQFIEMVYDYETNPNDWVYEGSLPAIVDFYADWCAPCRIIAPILDELAKEYESKIIIYKVDTEREKDLARAFNIRSIPTLLFIPAEGRPQISQGALPKETLKQVIDNFLLGDSK
jgi:thioredoxin